MFVNFYYFKVAMSLIRTKTKFKEPDDVLEVTWSFLWNITGKLK